MSEVSGQRTVIRDHLQISTITFRQVICVSTSLFVRQKIGRSRWRWELVIVSHIFGGRNTVCFGHFRIKECIYPFPLIAVLGKSRRGLRGHWPTSSIRHCHHHLWGVFRRIGRQKVNNVGVLELGCIYGRFMICSGYR